MQEKCRVWMLVNLASQMVEMAERFGPCTEAVSTLYCLDAHNSRSHNRTVRWLIGAVYWTVSVVNSGTIANYLTCRKMYSTTEKPLPCNISVQWLVGAA